MLNPISFLKAKYWSWRVRAGIRLIDEMMKKARWPRWKRRQVSRDLLKKHQDIGRTYQELKSRTGR